MSINGIRFNLISLIEGFDTNERHRCIFNYVPYGTKYVKDRVNGPETMSKHFG